MIKSSYSVIGVMSGTSLDGIDLLYATYLYTDTWSFKIHKAKTLPYTDKWTSILNNLPEKALNTIKNLDNKYSIYLANQIKAFIEETKINTIDFIASHGHTALHTPNEGLTYQIGNQQILADILQKKIICDFRVEDVALGGQGAPLVPVGDKLLFSEYTYCINLGGFANISFRNNNEKRIAYDICPVNIVLNHYVSKLGLNFDDKGEIAKSGSVNQKLLNDLNALDYYSQKPPKSLGLEWALAHIFPLINTYNLEIKNVLRTFVEHIAIQISETLQIKNATAFITGGGAYNQFLIDRIVDYSSTKICIPAPNIIEYKEALIFGLLGILKERDEVNCLSSVTGASRDHSSGKILRPAKF